MTVSKLHPARERSTHASARRPVRSIQGDLSLAHLLSALFRHTGRLHSGAARVRASEEIMMNELNGEGLIYRCREMKAPESRKRR